jgi:hypothetical protein
MLMIIFHIIIMIYMNYRLPSCDIFFYIIMIYHYGKLSKDYYNILEPLMGRPFGYSANDYSKLLLMKDYVPFVISYAHSFTTTYAFILL